MMFAILFALNAFAGADSSGGGKAVVCRDQAGKILSAEMLDIYEATNLYALTPLAMGNTVDEVMSVAKAKLVQTTFDSSYYGDELEKLRKKLHILPPGQKINPVDDADPVIFNPGCKLEQAALWVDSTLVIADREIWDTLDARNKVALYTHELIYSFMRFEGDKNSRRARKIVGHLFSEFEFTNARAGLPAEPRVLCYTAGSAPNSTYSEFWIYPDANGNLTLQFDIFHSREVYGRTTAVYKSIPYNPADRKQYVGEISELESNFEKGNSLFVSMVVDSNGNKDQLSTSEFDQNGNSVSAEIRCTKQP